MRLSYYIHTYHTIYVILYLYHFKIEKGWDCHGLPIELKALQGSKMSNMSPIQVRQKARECALTAINSQMQDFIRWGVMADWGSQSELVTKNKAQVNIGLLFI